MVLVAFLLGQHSPTPGARASRRRMAPESGRHHQAQELRGTSRQKARTEWGLEQNGEWTGPAYGTEENPAND